MLALSALSAPAQDHRLPQRDQRRYSIEQAVSDKAQLNTIAFNDYPCTGAFIYSEPIALPQILNTDLWRTTALQDATANQMVLC